MIIHSAEFIISNTDFNKCPVTKQPEFAFIGRSNVGKSSVINMLTNHKNLAKTSSTPGKTQTINHFHINKSWYLVDLPGYGYATISLKVKQGWSKMIEDYLLKRGNLFCTFVLIDSRLKPQKIDIEFISWIGGRSLPIALLFTKCDKLKRGELARSKKNYRDALAETWEEIPPFFVTSSEKKIGRNEVLDFIETAIKQK
ncbi:MAG: YihA family ribosome biogenesis GTP-binding protein [Bacteroidia bacterium]|nr:YihA family ribosome biogenesis GTP-binding protein [Bacteroidia bacterium]